MEEIIKFTYWWSQDLDQIQIKTQVGLSSRTAVKWDMFCREMCEIIVMNEGEPIGGMKW